MAIKHGVANGRDSPDFQRAPWQDTVRRLYSADALLRIKIVKDGVPAGFVKRLTAGMKISKDKFYAMTGLGRATVDRKIRDRTLLSQGESERVLGMAHLVGQAHCIVQESGSIDGFDAATWVASWLDRPHPVLGGKPPGEFMDTAEGRALVGNLLARQQSSAYS